MPAERDDAVSEQVEALRLEALQAYSVLGTSEDPAVDRITDLASRIFRVPVATASLVDREHVRFKSHYGVEVSDIARAGSLQDIVVDSKSLTVIPDVPQDERFQGTSQSIGGMRIRFYAGVPLVNEEGFCVGALSIMDTRPRAGLSSDEGEMLQDLGALVMDELKLQLEVARARLTSRSLKEGEARQRALMESASQGIIGINPAGRIQLVNRKAEELFGYTREELLGAQIEVLVPESVRHKHVSDRGSYFARPRARPMGIGLELRGRRKDGKEFPVEISLNYLEVDGEGLAISFITDITERTRLEQQLRQAQKMEAIGQLAGGVAHDFNNLLTVISGYSSLALDGLPPEDEMRTPLEEIHQAALRATGLTRQLLAFSRKQVVQPKVFDLNERVAQSYKMLKRLIGEDIDLELAMGEGIGDIRADPVQVDQVIMNLVVNGRDAMPNGGRLTIETGPVELDADYAGTHLSVEPGPHVMLAITDTGVGMTPEVQLRLFEPFFTTKEAGRGTGLGLATVYGIVKQAGGSIFVYSEVNRGTTFKILFPRADTNASIEAVQDEYQAHSDGETVLLVEDEESVRKFVATVLRDRGYRVLEVMNGDEALRSAAEFGLEIDCVLTDVVMPGISGPELITRLRQTHPQLRVLYMSGYTDRTVPLEASSGDAFIQKPFTPGQLHQRIREILQRR